MIVNTEGIVLKQRKIANNRRIIVTFSKTYGKINAGTSINEKSKGKSALALRPFTYAEYQIFKGRDYYNIDSATVKKSYYAIGEDFDRFIVASQILEYIDKITEEGQPRPMLFDLTIEFLESITRVSGNYETLLYAFIVKTLRMQGIMPELKCCIDCGKPLSEFGKGKGKKIKMFSVTSGGVICENCHKAETSTGSALIYSPSFDIIEVLQYFILKPMETFEKLKLRPEVSEQIKNILAEYIKHYLDIDVFKDEKG
ncbi:MAG TPA: DNA repair protein RecO [Mogibacterium sp.]|nr:DNA repair protein RecO [Mogibacterium sp.]